MVNVFVKTITLNCERICFLEKDKIHNVRENKVKDTSCLLNEVVNVRHRKKKCKVKVEFLVQRELEMSFSCFVREIFKGI